MTLESSEQPRETRDGVPLVTREAFRREVRAKQVQILEGVGKVSSPELASLAAKYLDFDLKALNALPPQAAGLLDFCADVRSLAASVLAQAEGNPRK